MPQEMFVEAVSVSSDLAQNWLLKPEA